MKLLFSLLVIATLGVTISLARSNDVCYNYIVCPSHCPGFGELPMVAIMIPLFTFEDFRSNMDSAITYINQYPGVITDDKFLLLHTSLNCKYSYRKLHFFLIFDAFSNLYGTHPKIAFVILRLSSTNALTYNLLINLTLIFRLLLHERI